MPKSFTDCFLSKSILKSRQVMNMYLVSYIYIHVCFRVYDFILQFIYIHLCFHVNDFILQFIMNSSYVFSFFSFIIVFMHIFMLYSYLTPGASPRPRKPLCQICLCLGLHPLPVRHSRHLFLLDLACSRVKCPGGPGRVLRSPDPTSQWHQGPYTQPCLCCYTCRLRTGISLVEFERQGHWPTVQDLLHGTIQILQCFWCQCLP